MEKTYTKKGEWLYTTYSKEEQKERLEKYLKYHTDVFPPSWAIYGALILGFIVVLFKEVFK